MWRRRSKPGVVWVNCTNMFDAACGFGGYRESGYGREGGREGLLEYMEPAWFKHAPKLAGASTEKTPPFDKLRQAFSQRTREMGHPGSFLIQTVLLTRALLRLIAR